MSNPILKYNHSDNRLADCIRILTMDAIFNVKSGHHGMPMGMADFMTVLFKYFFNFNPNKPDWNNRDRLVISNGHGSMLLYSLLYLTGYPDCTIDEIKNFRKLGSKTSGHPEFEKLSGIEATTGALGQGLANAVGMAFAAKQAATNISNLINHKIYCTVGDGCLMEGLSQESLSFAAANNLNNLIIIFDDNEITIDGKTAISTKENQILRFKALGFETFEIDGHNVDQIKNVLQTITSNALQKPIFISCKTIIGFGNLEHQGTSEAHGASISAKSIQDFKQTFKYPNEPFELPKRSLSQWRSFWERSEKNFKNSQTLDYPVLENTIKATQLKLESLKKYHISNNLKTATRQSISTIIDYLGNDSPFVYGSADLGKSTGLLTSSAREISSRNFMGNYINFGVREHGMAAISNGISLYKNHIPVISTFLTFSDYMRPAIRMSALMYQKVFYIFTHDSVMLGEDGPTHQPIEQIESLRLMPNLNVYRPCSTVELIECMAAAILDQKPSAFMLSRQNIEIAIDDEQIKQYNTINRSKKGAYIISKNHNNPQITIIASGSEVEVSQKIQSILTEKYGISTNTVSSPNIINFYKQTKEYKESIVPKDSFVVAIELANHNSYDAIIKNNGMKIGLHEFGESGNPNDIAKHYNLEPEILAERIATAFKTKNIENL